jgi:UDP-glucose 4-epimerase
MRIAKVLVTGGSGRVGRYVLRELAKEWRVTNADLLPAHAESVEYRATDVLDLDAVRRAVADMDAVVHLAALDFDWKAAPEAYIRVNILGSWHVLQASAEAGVRKVVLCSSVSACGFSEMRPDWRPNSLPVDERHENRPAEAYGVSKVVLERMGLSFVHAGQMDVICLRPMAVVMRESIDDFISFIDVPQRRWLFDYVTANDAARAFAAALRSPGPRYGVFFLSAADSCRPEPTLEWYRDRLGGAPELVNQRVYAVNPRASIFSSLQAREALGWEPTSDFTEIRRTWAGQSK